MLETDATDNGKRELPLKSSSERTTGVTVILCTYNRCASLARALESLAASIVPKTFEWEVLVVDNNSSDRTRKVAESFSLRYPGRFRYIFEPLQGLSQARNTGIREASGEILAFVDDDVTVEPTWLENLTTVLHDGNWAGSGGRVLPERSFEPPPWLAIDGPISLLGPLCAHFDQGDSPGELKTPAHGANMAFRSEMFEKYGNFRSDLGRCSNNLMSNEDTEFGHRLITGGEPLYYAPSATVYHEIHEDRIRKEFFLSWWFDFGRARIREAGIRPKLCGIPRHYFGLPNNLIRILPIKTLRWLLTLNPQQRFYNKCMAWAAAGRAVEILRQSP